jgi:hypothetical protein
MDRPRVVALLGSEQAALAIGACVLLSHLLLIGLPFVNLEFAFSAATQFFASHDEGQLAVYFHYQANTLGIPLLSFGLHKLLPFVDIAYLPRVVSMLGIPLFTLAILRLNRLMGWTKVPPSLVVGVCLLNPFVWTFSGRGTADFLPMAVGVFGLSLIWGESLSIRRIAVASIVFGLAIVLKYHAGIFLLFGLFDAFLRRDVTLKRRISRSFLLAAASGLLPILYVIAVKLRFGFWFTPPVYQDILHVKLGDAVTNSVVYLTYLLIMLIPLSLGAVSALPAPRRRGGLVWGAVLALTILSAVFVKPKGEMGFGPLDDIIAPWFLGMLSMVGALLFCALFLRVIEERDRHDHSPYPRYAATGIVFFVAVLSLSRPAQRYLMLPLPIAYLTLFGRRSSSPLIVASIAALPFFALINGVIAGHQLVQGGAAEALTSQISASGLLAVTDAGAIEVHAGLPFFPYHDQEKRYKVVSGKRPDAILSAERSLFWIMKGSFSVVPTQKPLPK